MSSGHGGQKADRSGDERAGWSGNRSTEAGAGHAGHAGHADRVGRTDRPSRLRLIHTGPARRYARWDVAEYFDSGRTEVEQVLAMVEEIAEAAGLVLGSGRALELGCGIGRVTQALCGHFDRVDGVDTTLPVIAAARRLNQYGRRCGYHLDPDLGRIADATFDFAYCPRLLHHSEPLLSRVRVEGLVRTLKAGGLLVFQFTTGRVVGATGALPASAFRASIGLLDAPDSVGVGEPVVVTALVENTGDRAWPAIGDEGWFHVTVGNHWSLPGGARVINDDARARLPRSLEPGHCAVVELVVTAPVSPGAYRLEVDLCQEGVAWFGDRGSEPAAVDVRVTGRRPRWWHRRGSRASGGHLLAGLVEPEGVPARVWTHERTPGPGVPPRRPGSAKSPLPSEPAKPSRSPEPTRTPGSPELPEATEPAGLDALARLTAMVELAEMVELTEMSGLVGPDDLDDPDGGDDRHVVAIDQVAGWVEDAGGILLRVLGTDRPASSGARWQSRTFVATR